MIYVEYKVSHILAQRQGPFQGPTGTAMKALARYLQRPPLGFASQFADRKLETWFQLQS